MTQIFKCYQIQGFSGHAREHSSGYKNAFSVPPVYGLKSFQNNAHNANLRRSSDECMAISVLNPMVLCLKLR